MQPTAETKRFTLKSIPDFEPLSPGHRACQGCGEILAMRQAVKALGENIIIINATGCMEVVTTPYPQTSWNVPWIHIAFENAGAVASGVVAARRRLGKKGRINSKETKIVIIGGDGSTSDIGFQSLSGALERGHDFVYLCLDNEAYMNTGIQRSSATPQYAWTTTSPAVQESPGKIGIKKNLPDIVTAHRIPYVATTTPAHPMDLMNKVRRAADTPGPAFVHIFSPCPTGWRMEAKYGVEIAKLAVKTNIYPLYEVIDGRYVLKKTSSKKIPVDSYLKMQGRFKHLSREDMDNIQKETDDRYEELVRRAGGTKTT